MALGSILGSFGHPFGSILWFFWGPKSNENSGSIFEGPSVRTDPTAVLGRSCAALKDIMISRNQTPRYHDFTISRNQHSRYHDFTKSRTSLKSLLDPALELLWKACLTSRNLEFLKAWNHEENEKLETIPSQTPSVPEGTVADIFILHIYIYIYIYT